MPAKNPVIEAIQARHPTTQAALNRANRKAILEHARMGESISTWRDGQVVWVPPAEVFALYGLDEFGREKQPEQSSALNTNPELST